MRRDLNTSAATLNNWLNLYDLKRRLRVPPNQSDAILTDPEVSRLAFSGCSRMYSSDDRFPTCRK